MSPFCRATDAPILDFWWCLPWVLKPGWISFACFLAYVILRFTSGATPAEWLYRDQNGSRAFLVHVPADVSAKMFIFANLSQCSESNSLHPRK